MYVKFLNPEQLDNRPPKYDLLTDEALVLLLRQGDEPAFSEIYNRYQVRIQTFFYRMFYEDFEKARDFTHDLFVKVIENAHRFDPAYSFRAWLYSLAHNLCKNEFRQLDRKNKAYAQIAESGPGCEPDGFHLEEPDRNWLLRGLNHLPPAQRQCLLLHYQEGLSVPEIASVLDCPEGTVKSRLFYALKNLSKKLRSMGIFQ